MSATGLPNWLEETLLPLGARIQARERITGGLLEVWMIPGYGNIIIERMTGISFKAEEAPPDLGIAIYAPITKTIDMDAQF